MYNVLKERRDLKLIGMSATIQIELYTNYFKKNLVGHLKIAGKPFPTEIIWSNEEATRTTLVTKVTEKITSIFESGTLTINHTVLANLPSVTDLCKVKSQVNNFTDINGIYEIALSNDL